MLNLEFKRAKFALKAGRLEDVAVILGGPKVRQHRRGQSLIDELVASYVQRGRAHFESGSVAAAREDVYAAIKLGGRQVEAVKLLEQIKAQVKQHSQPSVPGSIANAVDLVKDPSRKGPATNVANASSSLLHVDGLGCMMLFPQSQVTLGGVGGSQRADVCLQTEGVESPISITRDGEDYFADGPTTIRINDRTVPRALLSSGDLIQLGRRGRVRFFKPVAASASAVLQLTGAGIERRDVRHLVMLDDSLLFGAIGCHFKLASLPKPVLLFRNSNTTAERSSDHFLLGRLGDNDSAMPLAIGQSQVIDDVRFGLGEFA